MQLFLLFKVFKSLFPLLPQKPEEPSMEQRDKEAKLRGWERLIGMWAMWFDHYQQATFPQHHQGRKQNQGHRFSISWSRLKSSFWDKQLATLFIYYLFIFVAIRDMNKGVVTGELDVWNAEGIVRDAKTEGHSASRKQHHLRPPAFEPWLLQPLILRSADVAQFQPQHPWSQVASRCGPPSEFRIFCSTLAGAGSPLSTLLSFCFIPSNISSFFSNSVFPIFLWSVLHFSTSLATFTPKAVLRDTSLSRCLLFACGGQNCSTALAQPLTSASYIPTLLKAR